MIQVRWLLLIQSLLFTFIFTACSRYEPTVDMNVKVQRDKNSGVWRLTYDSTKGFNTLDFDRQRYRLRARTWRIKTEGVKLVQTETSERIVADRLITHFEAEFDDRTPGIPNDYPVVSYYSDGGAILYTGHLFLKVPECDGCKVNHHFTYIPPEGDSVITEENGSGVGDFVYFGQHTVTEYDSFRAITDDGLPPWIQRQIERSLPTFIVHYQEKLGITLPKKPLVFVAYDKALQVKEEGYLGGVVGSHMQLVLVGSRWNETDGVRYEKFAHLVAHETFHLWNGALYLAPDTLGGSWLHEGSAEAVADYALYELGYYDQDRYHQVLTERLNRCVVGLSRRSLPNSDEEGSYRNFYECGAVMNHLIEMKLASGQSLFDFWNAIFHSSQNSFYSHDNFFSAASSMVNDQTAVSFVSNLASGSTGDLSNFFENNFNQMSIPFSVSSASYPAWYEELEAENIVGLLAEKDCRSTVPVDLGENGIHVEGTESCDSFKSARELRKVDGYELPANGAEAHDALFNQCSTNPIAKIYDSNGEHLATSCLNFPKRPDFIKW